jgi:diguanylate cyclase (GGDEF)-like protein
LAKAIILRYRRHLAAQTEQFTGKTFYPELLSSIRTELKHFDAVCNAVWFRALPIGQLPQLADYMSLEAVEQRRTDFKLLPRQYDEKFHTLLTPTLFFPDLGYYRQQCETRRTSLAIAFIDIDNFGKFNRTHTETKVDTNMLPVFMRAVDAHVYSHGHAYRQGGDEYIILLPSVSRNLAILFMDELRKRLAALRYEDISEHSTVSIGLCVAQSDCPLTDQELLYKANEAKKVAKNANRNCIATYQVDDLGSEPVVVGGS